MTTLAALVDAVRAAHAGRTSLRLRGGGSKDFYGSMLAGDVLEVGAYQGVTDYRPEELCLTARAGTPLAEIEELLAGRAQMLPFEPPHFGRATLGGAVASGLAGPRRMQAGSVRDHVLGVRLIDGQGELLRFGGPVVKNVAGYDVPRLLAGSLGTLGLIAEVTLRLLPRPESECSLAFDCDQREALIRLGRWAVRPLPVSATFWHEGVLVARLSGARPAVEAARKEMGGEPMAPAEGFWREVREQKHPAFAGGLVWRLAVPASAPPLELPGDWVLEWGGAQRWLRTPASVAEVRHVAGAAGGHATLFRAPESLRCLEGAFAPLSPPLLALHQRLKKTFDPAGILNPGRLYAEL